MLQAYGLASDVTDFRERTGGHFFLEDPTHGWQGGRDVMPFLRFVQAHGGVALDLWTSSTHSLAPEEILGPARLDWPVESRPALVPTEDEPVPVRGYQVLVRPDTGQPLSVVKTAYQVAHNHSVASAALDLGRTQNEDACLIGAVGFGRTGERMLLVVRVEGDVKSALVLLAQNAHREGAVRFQLVEADREGGCVLAPGLPRASLSVAHVGNMEERLHRLRFSRMVQDYAEHSRRMWDRLSNSLWTPRHTAALLAELWPQTMQPPWVVDTGVRLVHPGVHLTARLRDCTDAGTAYRRLCQYLDNESEARERGDFTKDRDQRLALGAGLGHKQRAWRWIEANT